MELLLGTSLEVVNRVDKYVCNKIMFKKFTN
jgi:hypothetical protein